MSKVDEGRNQKRNFKFLVLNENENTDMNKKNNQHIEKKSRKEEIIKIRAEINKIKMKHQYKESMKLSNLKKYWHTSSKLKQKK